MSRAPKLLDLFCCGGGAARGYQLAGFDVTGVDHEAQPGYPGTFVQADAFQFLARHGAEFAFIHASPPCQGYSGHVQSRSSQWVPTLGKDEPRLIGDTLSALRALGRPWAVENVMGARDELRGAITLCGSMFGLPIARHRLFLTSWTIPQPMHPKCSGNAKRFAEARGWEYRDMSVTGKGRRVGTSLRWREIMGIDWPLTQHQLAEAIPPAYAQFIGSLAMFQHFPDHAQHLLNLNPS